MRRSEGPLAEERAPELPGGGVDRAGLDCFHFVEWRKDRREPAREHALAGARRPQEEEVVAAGGRDLERQLRIVEPAHLSQVHLAGALARIHLWRAGKLAAPAQPTHHLR